MSDRKYSARTAFFLALAATILCGIALPAFGRQDPTPPPVTQDTPGAVQPARNPAEDCGKPGVICDRLEPPAQEPPQNLSPQDPVAPRTTVDTLADVKKNGKLRVGVSMIVPWAMHDKDGNLVGFEIDIAKKMARDLGVEVEFYPEEFRYLIPDLRDSRFDVIISGMSITTNRAMQANFSAPYNYVELTLVANKQVAGNFKSLADFDKPNVTIGVLDTSTAVDIAASNFPNADLRTYTESADIFTDLLDGKLYAALADSPRPEIIAKLYPDNVYLPETKPLATFPAAFAVRRGDSDFIAYLNAWIEARTVNKWLENRRNYWFKTTDWQKRL